MRIAFQPIQNILCGRRLGYEALMRPLDGTSPLVLLQQARRNGTIAQLDSMARNEATHDAINLLAENESLFLNAEPETLMDIRLWEPWPYPIPPSRIVIEISERTMNDGLHPVIYHLKQIGVRLAIDDFGTGMSNLWMLDSFCPEFIKLDQGFLRRRAQGRTLEAVVAMTRRLGTRLIVEGVEAPSDANYLRSIQVVYAQGFHLGVPMFPEHCNETLNPSTGLDRNCMASLRRPPASFFSMVCLHRNC